MRWSTGNLEIIIYLIIIRLDNRAYTNQILRILHQTTNKPINYASIHWFVRKGERDGLLTSWWEREENRLVRYFALTTKGVKRLNAHLSDLETFAMPAPSRRKVAAASSR